MYIRIENNPNTHIINDPNFIVSDRLERSFISGIYTYCKRFHLYFGNPILSYRI